MKKIISVVVVLLISMCCLTSCSKDKGISSDNPEVQEIESVVYKGIEALNEEDIEKYIETCVIDEGDTGYTYDEYLEEFKASIYDVFEILDLHYEVESIKVNSLTGQYAEVEVVMTIVDTRENSSFENVRNTNILQMTKESGEWLVDESNVMYSDPLEQ